MAVDLSFVYFDLGNVLVRFDPRIACANLASLLGISAADARRLVYESGLQHRFEAAEQAAGVPAQQILFLDDLAENVQAARARGWNSEQCVGGEPARLALLRHGVIGHDQ